MSAEVNDEKLNGHMDEREDSERTCGEEDQNQRGSPYMTMFSSYWETGGAKDSGYEEAEKRKRKLTKKIEGEIYAWGHNMRVPRTIRLAWCRLRTVWVLGAAGSHELS